MATKKKSSSSVTRIKATSSKSAPKAAPKSTAATAKKPTVVSKQANNKTRRPVKGIFGALLRPFTLLGGYFKGAWVELRQVRWPNRQATWSLTLAVLLFTAFFATLILLLDAGFKYLFELLLT